LFNVDEMHVLDVVHDAGRQVVTVESDQDIGGCPVCGAVALGHGRRVHTLADAPCFGMRVTLRWRKRVFRGRQQSCPVMTFSEIHVLAPPGAKLTARAVAWATDALAHDDTTVSALARHLGVDWLPGCWPMSVTWCGSPTGTGSPPGPGPPRSKPRPGKSSGIGSPGPGTGG
jgi:hypothetical protein